jgi:replicative DNA helicase
MVTTNGHYAGIEDRDLSLPPHALDAEEAVIGSLLKNPRAISLVADEIEPRDFYDKRHQLIWKAMLAQEADGEPIDYHLVAERLRKHGDYDQAGGMLRLSEITLATPSAAHIVYYAKIVCTYADYRRLISLSQGLAEGAWRGAKTPQALMDEMQRRMAKLSARTSEGGAAMSVAMTEALAHMDRERDRYRAHDFSKGDYMSGWKTGIPTLDAVLLGMKPGDLIYLAARTSVGKSILAQQIAMNVANHGGGVLYASLEMSYIKLTWRAITMTTGVLRHELVRGNVTDEERDRVHQAGERMAKLPLYWETAARTVESIRRRAQRWSDEINMPLALVVVDYVQLLRDQAGPRANRYENVSAASHALKEMAEAMQCTVLAPAQVSRAVTNRASKMPDLSDLRESGDLEQDCDLALGLDRQDYWDRSTNDHTATLAVLKARDLAAGRGRGTLIPLVWLAEYEQYGEAHDNVIPFRRSATLPDDLPPTTTPPADDHGELPF